MTTRFFPAIYVAVCVLTVMTIFAPVRAHPQETAEGAVLKGYVRDSGGRPVVDAFVFLQLATQAQNPSIPAQVTRTDSEGVYRFASLPAGTYTLRAELAGYGRRTISRVPLARREMKKIDITLFLSQPSEPQYDPPTQSAPAPANSAAQAPQFFDEPQFTVAGVTQATNSGGHGSDTVLRTTEALARATVSLGNESVGNESVTKKSSAGPEPPEPPEPMTAATEDFLRDAVARNPNDPALHHRLGNVEENLGKPLEAVHEYQRAAELDPSEPYLFDWGTELLTHRALEPATEVFTKGNRLFPKSVRMLVALGVSWYARGSYDQATQCLAEASDLAPDDPTPYLFLGKMQSVETTPLEASVEEVSVKRLARFAERQPDNALANYYYAVSLWKQSGKQSDTTSNRPADSDSGGSAYVESLLQKAVHLDPTLGAAYLQLGILYARRTDFARAISAYQKAIEVSRGSDETLAESHYRLAQAYLRSGDKAKAQAELKLHAELDKKLKEDTDRERRKIQEFVISLRNKDSVSQ